ncbi:type IV pilin biogenesis protein [Acidithiobacillus sulfurivorans]|uniref:Type IV pilin biogenesis protein n=1 Tax=Acidithiobacillus sulfurivorans TaxID=1958756 RepID=A0ABS6A279_9PROT|nr:type IV pilin biogenesis protein [Acidithiobacillus sulfurivorans]MBU2761221.1 type IV pilin biogenesis protein [Acidithiobacillus sulfurivorans]
MQIKLHNKLLASFLIGTVTCLPLSAWATPQQPDVNINNTPSGSQPQVMIIIDNSQGMAGVVEDPITGLSGAIMTGSGVVAENNSSSSPVNYNSGDTTPIAYGNANSSVPYTVNCDNTSGFTAPALSACQTVSKTGYSTYLDNSPSMLNAAKQAISNIIGNVNYTNSIQFGLEDYKYSASLNDLNSSIYYMFSNGLNSSSFSSTAPSGILGINYAINPCYQNSSNSCQYIAYNYFNHNYYNNSPSYQYKYLEITDSSDNPLINSVLYSSSYLGNNIYYSYQGTYKYTISNYENQLISPINSPYTKYNASTYYSGYSTFGPSNPGYLTQTPQVWTAARGYAFFGSTVKTQSSSTPQGNIIALIGSSAALSKIASAIEPAPLMNPASGFNYNQASVPIEAGAGHTPMAGALKTALNYFGRTGNNAPPSTCGQKYVIIITNGQPTQGLNGHLYPPLGSQAATTFGFPLITAATASSSSTDYNNAAVEAIQQIANLNSAGIKTYVLGVGSAVNPNTAESTSQNTEATQGQAILTAMAQAGGTGYYYSAQSTSQLNSALSSIVANILSNTITSPIAATGTATSSSLEFVQENINKSNGQGNMFAFPFNANGVTASTTSNAVWDANTVISSSVSSSTPPVYTTAPTSSSGSIISGSAILLSSAATSYPNAFGTNLANGLTPSIIANYTVNPSASSNSTYLGGRAPNWTLGLPTTSTPQIILPPDNSAMLSAGNGSNSYTSFASSNTSRKNMVLFSSNDGILYGISYNGATGGSPSLTWSWVPYGLLNQLQSYNTFWRGQSMQGGFKSISATDANGNWNTYVVGSALGGGILYDLKLSTVNNTANLNSVIYENDLGPSFSQPITQSPIFYQISSPGSQFGQTWALWVVNNNINSTSTSYLVGVNVGSGVSFQDQLPFVASSALSIDTNNNIYLGSSNGYVYSMPVTNIPQISGTSTNSTVISSTSFPPVITASSFGSSTSANAASYAPWASSSSGLSSVVQYMTTSYYLGNYYLSVQGQNGFTVFQKSANNWQALWASYTGGSKTYSTTNTPQTITGLPNSSVISAPIAINNGAIIAPVTVSPAANTCGENTAYYFLYKLLNGAFPSGFFDLNGTSATGPILIGYGTAYTPTIISTNGRTLIQSAAGDTGSSGQFPAFYQNGSTVKVIGWRVINY